MKDASNIKKKLLSRLILVKSDLQELDEKDVKEKDIAELFGDIKDKIEVLTKILICEQQAQEVLNQKV